MGRPRLLDLFCGAGGAAMGYHRAGFDVVGVDLADQPRYPFTFFRADALRQLQCGFWRGFDAIHASPPCQRYSLATRFHHGARDNHPDLIDQTRELLEQTGLPYVIENVPGAPLRRDLVLCGEMFELRVHRHRWFECGGFTPMRLQHQPHRLRGARTNCETGPGIARWVSGHYADHQDASDAMGIDWMTRDELREAIPPAYCELIGAQLMTYLRAVERERVDSSHARTFDTSAFPRHRTGSLQHTDVPADNGSFARLSPPGCAETGVNCPPLSKDQDARD